MEGRLKSFKCLNDQPEVRVCIFTAQLSGNCHLPSWWATASIDPSKAPQCAHTLSFCMASPTAGCADTCYPSWGWEGGAVCLLCYYPGKAQLWQSYRGAASTWALLPVPLLQSRQVWTRAGTHLMLWPAPLTVSGLVWRLSTPVLQSNGWKLGFCGNVLKGGVEPLY